MSIGRSIFAPVEATLTFVGECSILLFKSFVRLFRPGFEFTETLDQMAFVGVASLPIIMVTTFFSGAVFSMYTTDELIRYGAANFVGTIGGFSIFRELAPVLTGITVASRVGAASAAQVASMTVTEQVDALKMLSVNPIDYIVTPRLVANILMLPVLSMVGAYTGLVGGALVANARGVPFAIQLQGLQSFVRPWDLIGGMLKTPFFGIIVAIVACQQGLRTNGGAVGVGLATTRTVVISMVLVYFVNYFLASLFFH
jgi:phospholipid/cholesterol/gamma-HCH transport system permease protein